MTLHSPHLGKLHMSVNPPHLPFRILSSFYLCRLGTCPETNRQSTRHLQGARPPPCSQINLLSRHMVQIPLNSLPFGLSIQLVRPVPNAITNSAIPYIHRNAQQYLRRRTPSLPNRPSSPHQMGGFLLQWGSGRETVQQSDQFLKLGVRASTRRCVEFGLVPSFGGPANVGFCL